MALAPTKSPPLELSRFRAVATTSVSSSSRRCGNGTTSHHVGAVMSAAAPLHESLTESTPGEIVIPVLPAETTSTVKLDQDLESPNQHEPVLTLNSPVHLNRQQLSETTAQAHVNYMLGNVSSIAPQYSEEEKMCAICLESYEEKAEEKPIIISTLECGHVFHLDCILHWFSNSSRCPLCQKDFTGPPPTEGSRSRRRHQPVNSPHLSSKGVKVTLCVLVLVILTLAYLAWWSYANDIGKHNQDSAL